MIVCSCSNITERDVREAIAWMRAADPDVLITPGRVYRALGKSADCGGCMRLFVEKMRESDNLRIPDGNGGNRARRDRDARRQGRHRIPE